MLNDNVVVHVDTGRWHRLRYYETPAYGSRVYQDFNNYDDNDNYVCWGVNLSFHVSWFVYLIRLSLIDRPCKHDLKSNSYLHIKLTPLYVGIHVVTRRGYNAPIVNGYCM